MQKFKRKREVKLGIFLTLALFLFVWGINYLRGTDIFTRQIRFYVVYDEVSGLMETNPVIINGVNVGQVHRIAFHPDGSGNVIVSATVDRQIDIPANSTARLTSEIIGTNKIIVELGDHPEPISSGDTLVGIKDPGITEQIEHQIGPLRDRATDLIERADTLLFSFNQLLDEQNRYRITSGIDSFQQAMASMKSAAHQLETTMHSEAERISRMLEHAEAITRNLDDNRTVINHILENMSEVSDQLHLKSFSKPSEAPAIPSVNSLRYLKRSTGGKGLRVCLFRMKACIITSAMPLTNWKNYLKTSGNTRDGISGSQCLAGNP